MEEHHAPVAQRGPLRQVEPGPLGVVEDQLEALEQRSFRALDFLICSGTGHHFRNGPAHGLLGHGQRVLEPHPGVGHQQPRLAELPGERPHRRSLLGAYQGLVEPSRGCVAQHFSQHLHCGKVGVGSGGHVVRRHRNLFISHPAQRHRPLAILIRFVSVGGPQQHVSGPLRPRDGAELLRDQASGRALLELARDDEDGVVRLVIPAVERLQAFDRHFLDVAPRADRGIAVVVPEVRGGHHPLQQNAEWIVLARLELIPDHGELAREIILGDETVDHPVGLEVERPLQVLRCRGKGLEVVGTIGPGGAVGTGAVAGQLSRDVGMVGRTLEHEVLEEVRHARLAVGLVPGAHQVGHVDGGGWLGRVRKQQHPQAVGKAVLGDALDRGLLGEDGDRWSLGKDRRERSRRESHREQRGGQEARQHEPNSLKGVPVKIRPGVGGANRRGGARRDVPR